MKKLLAYLGLGLSVTLLSACGTTQVEESETGTSSGGPVSVTDGAGETFELDSPASRVVTLEWDVTEMAASVGVDPVGVADVEGFANWDSAVELPEGTEDVGLRQEPSLESIGRLAPDLIIGVEGSVPEDAMSDMQEIAPVLILTSADAADPIGQMRSNMETVSTVLGKEDVGQEVWQEYETAVEDAGAAIEEAGRAGTPVALAYAAIEGNTATFRMHGPGSLPIAIATEAGLGAAWTDEGDPAWGLSSADVEGLTALPEDTEFLWWQNTPTEESPLTTLEQNQVWNDLGFVQAGNVQPAANQIWIYGGPKSAAQWATQLAELTTN